MFISKTFTPQNRARQLRIAPPAKLSTAPPPARARAGEIAILQRILEMDFLPCPLPHHFCETLRRAGRRLKFSAVEAFPHADGMQLLSILALLQVLL